jgi:valyl-tRNA synthetase
MPFVTEELWQNLRQTAAGESIMKAPLPEPDPSCIDPVVESEMAFMQKVIDSVRNIRGEMGIPPGREISLVVRSSGPARADQMSRYAGYLRQLARVSSFEATQNGSRPRHAASAVVEGEEIFVPLEGIIDLEVERARLGKEITRVSGLLEGSAKKLASEGFVQRAPEEVVRKEQDKVDRLTKDLEKLRRNLEALQ